MLEGTQELTNDVGLRNKMGIESQCNSAIDIPSGNVSS